MRKVLVIGLCMALCLSAFSFALAEEAAVSIDWSTLVTQIVIGLIGVAAAALNALMVWVWKRWMKPVALPWIANTLVPWLEEHRLKALADELVKAAEAELGRFTGELKWDKVVQWLAQRGYDINVPAVHNAVMAAWESLNLQQIQAGLKDALEGAGTLDSQSAPQSGLSQSE